MKSGVVEIVSIMLRIDKLLCTYGIVESFEFPAERSDLPQPMEGSTSRYTRLRLSALDDPIRVIPRATSLEAYTY